jgi:hypothetical protein
MTATAVISDRTSPPKESFTPDAAAANAHREHPATHPAFNHSYNAMTAENGKTGMKSFDPEGHGFTISGADGEGGIKGKDGTKTVAQNTETTETTRTRLTGSQTFRNPDADNPNFSTVGNDQLKTLNYSRDGGTSTAITNTSGEGTIVASNEPAPIRPGTQQVNELPDPRKQNVG